MAETLEELRSLPDEELIRRHDAKTGHTMVGTAHYLRELERRDQERGSARLTDLTERLTDYTSWLKWLTLIVTIATVANVAAAIALLVLEIRRG